MSSSGGGVAKRRRRIKNKPVIANLLSEGAAIWHLHIRLTGAFSRREWLQTVPHIVLLWRRCREATEEDKKQTCHCEPSLRKRGNLVTLAESQCNARSVSGTIPEAQRMGISPSSSFLGQQPVSVSLYHELLFITLCRVRQSQAIWVNDFPFSIPLLSSAGGGGP